MAIIVGFLVAIAAIGGLLYVLLIHGEVPGAAEQRFGVLEPLPPDVGKWRTDDDSEEGRAAARRGLRREERFFHDPNGKRATLVKQVRYRNPATNAITHAEPDVLVRRRRVRS